MNPMKRFGDPREIAETVLFLVSDGAGYMNGQVIHAEGGWVPVGLRHAGEHSLHDSGLQRGPIW